MGLHEVKGNFLAFGFMFNINIVFCRVFKFFVNENGWTLVISLLIVAGTVLEEMTTTSDALYFYNGLIVFINSYNSLNVCLSFLRHTS